MKNVYMNYFIRRRPLVENLSRIEAALDLSLPRTMRV
jgi:hypothetical protein